MKGGLHISFTKMERVDNSWESTQQDLVWSLNTSHLAKPSRGPTFSERSNQAPLSAADGLSHRGHRREHPLPLCHGVRTEATWQTVWPA